MPTYAIGDVQGCFEKLIELLEVIGFSEKDTLWFTGDLVNRGTESLKTLRFIRDLHQKRRVSLVLGNHDLGMLAIANGAYPYDPAHHSFSDILEAPDKDELLNWLEEQPLIHHDPSLNYTLVHAGIYPNWDLEQAQKYASEVEQVLKNRNEGYSQKIQFYHHLFGNTPTHWDPELDGFDRLRFIVNCFTRMRFVSLDGHLNLNVKEAAEKAPKGFFPWFEIPHRKCQQLPIIFGHWAALQGKCRTPNTFALDTGCVWGNALTAFRLEDQQRFSVSCSDLTK